MKKIIIMLAFVCGSIFAAEAKNVSINNQLAAQTVGTKTLDIKGHSRTIGSLYENINTTLNNAKSYDAQNQDNWYMVESQFMQISYQNAELDRRGQEMIALLEQENAPREVYINLYQTLHNLYSIQSDSFRNIENANGTLSRKGQRCQQEAESLAKKYLDEINKAQKEDLFVLRNATRAELANK